MGTLLIHQDDDEVVAIGPILTPTGGYYVPAVGDTTTLVVKANKHVADATGITYAGTLVEDSEAAGQWYSTFEIPQGDWPTLGVYFFRCRVINAAGAQQTIIGDRLEVNPGTAAQRASATNAPVLDLTPGVVDGGTATPLVAGIIDGGAAAA